MKLEDFEALMAKEAASRRAGVGRGQEVADLP